jgi:hypothetical protein
VVVVIPFAFMVAWLWTRRPLDRGTIARGIAPFLVVVVAEAAFHAYLVLGPGLPSESPAAWPRGVSMSLQAVAQRARRDRLDPDELRDATGVSRISSRSAGWPGGEMSGAMPFARSR